MQGDEVILQDMVRERERGSGVVLGKVVIMRAGMVMALVTFLL
jgi:hypothetical protein